MAVARRSRVLVDGRARPLSRRAITDWVDRVYIAHNGTCSLCALCACDRARLAGELLADEPKVGLKADPT